MSHLSQPKGGGALAAGLLITGLVVVVFFGLIFRGQVLFEGDIHGFLWGQCAAFADVLRGGSWPVWNPYVSLGQPMLASPGTQVLYPPTWLNLLVRPETYFNLYAAGHLLLAGAGMLWLARTLGFSWTAAATGGAVWVLSGPLLSSVDLWQHFAGAAWMPWVVAGSARCLDRPSLGRVLGWALFQSAQVTTGSLDIVVLTALPQAILLLTHLSWRRPLDRGNGRLLVATALAAALTVAWTAALWMPAADLLGRTMRADQSSEERMKWSVPPIGLVQTVLPLLPQDLPLRDDVRLEIYGWGRPLFTSLYLGLPALVLGLGALCSTRRALVAGASVLVAVSLLLALGRWGLVYFWVMEAAPGLTVLRYPAKATLLTAFGFALLVALGLEAWKRGAVSRRAALLSAALVGGLGALALLGAAWLRAAAGELLAPTADHPLLPGAVDNVLALVTWSGATAVVAAGLASLAARSSSRGRVGLVAGLAALAIVDLLVVHRGLNATVPRNVAQKTPEVVRLLRADGARRVFTFDYFQSLAGNESLRPEPPPAYRRLPLQLRHFVEGQAIPFSTPRWDLRGSYEIDLVGLDSPPRRGLRLLSIAVEREPERLLRLLQVGGITHVVALHREGLHLLKPLATVRHSMIGDVHVYRVPGTLPPVLLADGRRVARGLSAYQALLDPSLDPRATVILAEGAAASHSPGFQGTAQILEERADRLRVRALASSPALLLVTDGFDEGWRATVDGEPAPVLRANLAFRAVAVPAGPHEVEMTYVPPGLARGAVLSGISVGGVLALLLTRRRRTAGSRGTAPGVA